VVEALAEVEDGGVLGVTTQRDGQHAMAAAREARNVTMEGKRHSVTSKAVQLPSWSGRWDHEWYQMWDMFALAEDPEVNGRGVWKCGVSLFMYYGNDKEWTIGGRAWMEAEKATNWTSGARTAFTPDQSRWCKT
jgi:hypothetical protein